MYSKAIAREYTKWAISQTKAGKILIDMLPIKGNEDILDIGCASGFLTSIISKKTTGNIVGLDNSIDMLNQAKKINTKAKFLMESIESMNETVKYDIIFCNSILHWCKSGVFSAVRKIYNSLNKNGYIAIQTTINEEDWSPEMCEVIRKTCNLPVIREIYKTYTSPWCLLGSVEKYKNTLSEVGFSVLKCEYRKIEEDYNLEQALNMFKSGAGEAYLDSENYKYGIDDKFKKKFLNGIEQNLMEYIPKNKSRQFCFNRLFLIGKKVNE